MIYLDEQLRRTLQGPYQESKKALFSLEMYDKVSEWGQRNPAVNGAESEVKLGSWSVKILSSCDPRDAAGFLHELKIIQEKQPDLKGLRLVLGAFAESPTAVAAAGKSGDIYFFNHRESGRLFAAGLQEVSKTTIRRLIYHELAHVAENLKDKETAIAVRILMHPEEMKSSLLQLNQAYFAEINKLFVKIEESTDEDEKARLANYIAGEAVAEIFASLQTGEPVPKSNLFSNVSEQLRGDYSPGIDLMSVPIAQVNGVPVYRFGI